MAIADTRRERGAVLLRDPLSEVVRKERRALLAAATIGYVVTKTGLLPSKIEALGIEFTAKEQGGLLAVFALVVIYFVVTFIVYAATDALRLAWEVHLAKVMLTDEANAELAKRGGGVIGSLRVTAGVEAPRFRYRHLIVIAAFIRGIWEFVVPVAIGVYVVVVLLLRAGWQ